jgi:hypothetical protein
VWNKIENMKILMSLHLDKS